MVRAGGPLRGGGRWKVRRGRAKRGRGPAVFGRNFGQNRVFRERRSLSVSNLKVKVLSGLGVRWGVRVTTGK